MVDPDEDDIQRAARGLPRGPWSSTRTTCRVRSNEYAWSGFRDEEHRITPEYNMAGFESCSDWPHLTLALAEAGFTEEEPRKPLGLNYPRVCREVVGEGRVRPPAALRIG